MKLWFEGWHVNALCIGNPRPMPRRRHPRAPIGAMNGLDELVLRSTGGGETVPPTIFALKM
jgi:hypothetical protein